MVLQNKTQTLIPYLVLIVGAYLIFSGSARLYMGFTHLIIIHPDSYPFIHYTRTGLLYVWLGIIGVLSWSGYLIASKKE